MFSKQEAWIKAKKVTGITSVDVFIDLTPYFMAYRNKQEGHPRAAALFNTMRSELVHETSVEGLSGAVLLSNLIELATKDRPSDQILIESTPAYDYMADSFSEALKNSMDEALEQALISHENKVYVRMRIDFELDKSSNTIAITCSDQGRGFSEELIDALSSPETRRGYDPLWKGSKKHHATDNLFFGGHNSGLKLLIAKVDNGYAMASEGQHTPLFSKPERSHLYFFNRSKEQGGGAVIRVVTSTDPLTLAQEKEDAAVSISPTI